MPWYHLGWALGPYTLSIPPDMAALAPGLGIEEKGLDTGYPG